MRGEKIVHEPPHRSLATVLEATCLLSSSCTPFRNSAMVAAVYIAASRVAAAIGRHRYRSRPAELCCILNGQLGCRFRDIQLQMHEDPEVAQFLATTGALGAVLDIAPNVEAVTDPETVRAALTARGRVLERRSAAIGAVARDAAAHVNDTEGAIRAAEQLEQSPVPAFTIRGRDHASQPLKDIYRRARNYERTRRLRLERAAALRQFAERPTPYRADELRLEAMRAQQAQQETEALAAAPSEVISSAIATAVVVTTGQHLENTVLDEVAQRRGAPVVQRNTRTGRMDGPNFRITGRADGIVHDDQDGGRPIIIEAKTRRRWFDAPPEYDIIQLQVYLRLFGIERGVLEERSQTREGVFRSTPVTCDDATWASIERELTRAAEEILAATIETVRAWVREAQDNLSL